MNECEGDYADEVTGVTLLRGDVAKARVEGNFVVRPVLEAFGDVTDETCMSRTGRKPISPSMEGNQTRATRNVLNCESRPVARDIKQKGTGCYLARTPSLALVRHLINKAKTRTKMGNRRLMVLDAKRAFLHTDALIET